MVEVLTSDIKGSGTDANVTIVIFGDKGDTGEHALENSANNFEKGMKVRPGGLSFLFCPNSLCLIPQIQPVVLE